MEYLHQVLPRLYQETRQWCLREWPELLPQLKELRIERRCDCAAEDCLDFDTQCPSQEAPLAHYGVRGEGLNFMIAVDAADAVRGFRFSDDYPDRYIQRQLRSHGWRRQLPERVSRWHD